MEGLSVTTEAIATAAGGVTDVGTALAGEITAMQGMLDDLQAGWQSTDASPRFAGAMTDHLAQAITLKDALLSHGQSLVSVGRTFDQVEVAIAATVPAVRA